MPGQVKTRLCPPLTEQEAADLYEAFLSDALESYSCQNAFGFAEPVALRLYVVGTEKLPRGLVPERITIHEQKGEGLGSRMLRAFVETFAAGFERIVILGTDHPTLPLEFVGEAFRALEAPFTVVLGPSEDGGFYLLGSNELYPSLFDMAYSHSAVFQDTLARVVAEGARPVVLPAWFDVDDETGLGRLLRDWRKGAQLRGRTESALKALLAAYPNLL